MPDPIFSFPVARVRPQPGIEPKDVELPGPGLYEADFRIPEWVAAALQGLGAEAFDYDKNFTVPFANGMDLEHLHTAWRGTLITLRVRLIEKELRPSGPEIQSQVANVGKLVVTVFRSPQFKLVVSLGIVSAVVKGLVEVRKLADITAGKLLVAGGGIALAGIGITRIKGAF